MKRFQECNKLVKVWRYRWYLLIPFEWVYYKWLNPMKIHVDTWDDNLEALEPTGAYEIPGGKILWQILVGKAQGKMNWTYTMEEVQERIDLRRSRK